MEDTTQPGAEALDLDQIEALARAATPGPWHWVNPENDKPRQAGEWSASLRTVEEFPTHSMGNLPKFIIDADEICGENIDANADFIAAANPAAVLRLVALARRAIPTPAPAQAVEAAAKAIYELFPADREGDSKTFPWQPGGNSFKQDDARRYARAALEAVATPTHAVGAPSDKPPAKRRTIGEVFDHVGGYWTGSDKLCPTFGSAEALRIYTVKMQRDAVQATLATQPASQACGEPADADDAANEVIVDRRDLFDTIRAAWREGQSAGPTDEAESWNKSHDYASSTIKGWGTLRSATPLATTAAPPQGKPDGAQVAMASLRDKLRWSKANTDYHGYIAFTPSQLEHFASMLTESAAAPERSDKPAETAKPVFNIVPTLTKEKEAAAERGVCPDCGTADLHTVNRAAGMHFMQCARCKDLVVLEDRATQPTPSGKALPAQEGEQP